MFVHRALNKVASIVPVAGSAYLFTKTCSKVYNCGSPAKAVISGVKGIIIDCSLPVVKYPLLCAAALFFGDAACITDDPSFAGGILE